MEMTWKKFFQICKKRWWLIVACTLVLAAAGGLFAKFVVAKTYTSTLTLLLQAGTESDTGETTTSRPDQTLIANCVEILSQQQYFRLLEEEESVKPFGLDEEEISECVSFETKSNATSITVRVKTGDANASLALASAIESTAVEYVTGFYAEFEGFGVKVINPPTLAEKPDQSPTMTYTVIGAMAGFILSVLIVLLIYILDTRIKNREDLASRYEFPVIGVIPRNLEAGALADRREQAHGILQRNDFLLDEHSSFYLTESFRNLMMGVGFSVLKEPGKASVIAVASSLPMEGKSVVTANLGLTYAQSGKKVLIIDCDLRKARQGLFFDCVATKGLSNYLCGQNELSEVTVHTRFERLDAIFAGMTPPNPVELLQNGKLAALLEEVRKKYDVILIDTAPVNVVSDAMLLVPLVDGFLYVVGEKQSTHAALQRGLASLQFAKAKVLGLVLNQDEEEFEVKKYGKSAVYNQYYSSASKQEGEADR